MKKLLFFLLILTPNLSYANLYKCTTPAKTAYQDKPCQAIQTQVVIVQQLYKPRAKAAVLDGNFVPIERNVHGRIKRSGKAKNDFKAANPCPANGNRSGSCPGYVIDHIKPLACGGADSPENMQWQTNVAGKEKDAWERDNCNVSNKHRRY